MHGKVKGLNELLKLAGMRSNDPSFTIIPDDVSADERDVESAYAVLLEEYKGAGGVDFQKDRSGRSADELRGLNRTQHRVANIPGWADAADNYFEAGIPEEKCGNIEKFAASSLKANKGFSPPSHPVFDVMERLCRARDGFSEVMDRFALAFRRNLFAFISEEVERRKRERNVRTFDDLIADTHAALAGPAGTLFAAAVRNRFHAALIDEFQDTDPLQYRIFTGIFSGGPSALFLIGDPKQAIYGFRSADIFAYLNARKKAKAHFTLMKNWRTAPLLVEAVNTVFSNAPNPFVFPDIEFVAVEAARSGDELLCETDGKSGPPFEFWLLPHASLKKGGVLTKQDAGEYASAAVAAGISRLVRDGMEGRARIGSRPVTARDIAVLVKTNDQAARMQDRLRAFGVPGIVYGAGSVFQTDEAMELRAIMEAAADPSGESAVRTACATVLVGMNARDIYRITTDEEYREGVMERFHDYHHEWAAGGFMAMYRALVRREKSAPRILALPDGERRYTNFNQCAELVHRAESEGLQGMESLLKWLRERIADPGNADEQTIRLETDENAVTLITVHKSKGLEFPIVFCPFLWDAGPEKHNEITFHLPPDYRPVLDLGSGNGEYHRMADREKLAENVRLAYVALTRAKCRCIAVWGSVNGSDYSAPAWLLNRDTEDASTGEQPLPVPTWDDMKASVERCAMRSPRGISVRVISPDEGVSVVRSEDHGTGLHVRNFTGTISFDATLASYSSLSAQSARGDDHRDVDAVPQPLPEESHSEMSIHTFPSGTEAGSCFHGIFEKIDYDLRPESVTEVIESALRTYGISPEWVGVVYETVEKVITTTIPAGETALRLADIAKGRRLHELEFYLPVRALTMEGLAAVLDPWKRRDDARGIGPILEKTGFSPVRGYLRGFIDMVFEYRGKYYLLDWKSNNLGPGNYTREGVERAMREHNYYLQYFLYAVALHRFCAARVSGYDYRKHFGGVIYLFIRGVGRGDDETAGVFFDRPPEELIAGISAYFREGS
jgi:exodeoxyribonuclease V beta subunit